MNQRITVFKNTVLLIGMLTSISSRAEDISVRRVEGKAFVKQPLSYVWYEIEDGQKLRENSIILVEKDTRVTFEFEEIKEIDLGESLEFTVDSPLVFRLTRDNIKQIGYVNLKEGEEEKNPHKLKNSSPLAFDINKSIEKMYVNLNKLFEESVKGFIDFINLPKFPEILIPFSGQKVISPKYPIALLCLWNDSTVKAKYLRVRLLGDENVDHVGQRSRLVEVSGKLSYVVPIDYEGKYAVSLLDSRKISISNRVIFDAKKPEDELVPKVPKIRLRFPPEGYVAKANSSEEGTKSAALTFNWDLEESEFTLKEFSLVIDTLDDSVNVYRIPVLDNQVRVVLPMGKMIWHVSASFTKDNKNNGSEWIAHSEKRVLNVVRQIPQELELEFAFSHIRKSKAGGQRYVFSLGESNSEK